MIHTPHNLLHLGTGLSLRLDAGMRLSSTLAFSFLMHLFFLTLFQNLPTFSPSPPVLIPVSLVSLDFERPIKPSPSVAPTPPPEPVHSDPLPLPAMKAASQQPPNVAPAAPAVPQPSAVPDIEAPHSDEPEPILPSSSGYHSDEIVTASKGITASRPPEARPDTGNPTASVSAVSIGQGVSEGFLSRYAYYFEGIQQKIGDLWSLPLDLTSGGQQKTRFSAVVGFVVQRDGRIKKKTVILEKSSGNPFWDNSALRAIYNADPLLPLPSEMTEEIHVHFEFKLQHSS